MPIVHRLPSLHAIPRLASRPRPWRAAALALGILALTAAPAQAQGFAGRGTTSQGLTQGLTIDAVVELGNVPRSELSVPDFRLITNHLTGRLPRLSIGYQQLLAPQVMGVISGSLRQEIYQALSYPDLYQAELDRIQWRQAGGLDISPLYVPILDDAYVHLNDPARNGFLRVGQFELPFSYRTSSYEPPLPVAPVPTPVTEFLSAQDAGLYQGSAFGYWRDIGALLQWQSGALAYATGLVNGSGPNRMDDNAAKDVFLRVDYRPSATDEVGLSMLWGKELAYPDGFSQPGTPTEKRRAGLHAKITSGDAIAKFEYLIDQRLGIESVPRQGWYVDISQTTGPASSAYLQYAAFGDGNAAGGRNYEAKQVTLGGLQQLWEGGNLRLEGLWRWESATGIAINYGRYLVTMEFALGGTPVETSRRTIPAPNLAP